ncbi:lyase family protein [Massilia sp. CCM 9210]|uniref:lyase family protein n=1 Tax=Massilia scottii TaxID=3057166 RepID=UPI0027965C70|nr:lyase family protein [Massilia sp. CCM 9210]MDQ1815075.1 lyase family protein [Massilia sp. CCM 9210]
MTVIDSGPVQTFVFIESNTTGTGRLCLQKALLRGVNVLFLTSQPQLYSFLQEDMVLPVLADTSDAARIVDVLAAYPNVAAVFSTSEYYIEIAAEVAGRLGLPGADPAAIRRCRDKGLLYRCLREAGIGAADTVEVTSDAHLRDVARALSYPRVVKPAMGSGSVGVRLVHDAAQLLVHGDGILQARSNERGMAMQPKLLVQAYIEGPEFSVEVIGLGAALGHQVLGVTGKHLGPLPHFVEKGHDFPAPIVPALRDAIVAQTLSALRAVGHRFGPAHVECRVSAGQVVIIEINPRLAGGMIPQAIERATGIDVLGAVVDLYLGGTSDWQPRRHDVAAIRFVLPQRKGVLLELALKPTDRFPSVSMTFIGLKRNGQRIGQDGDYRDRIGLVIAGASQRAELERALEELDGLVTVRIAGEGDDNDPGTGRLRHSLHPEALAIVRKPASRAARLAEFDAFAAIDEAHLLMLTEAGICAPAKAGAVLRELALQRDQGYAAIIDAVAPRGGYALYEQLLIERLGMDIGGVVHTARSRNDINACIAKLQVRRWFETSACKLWRLRATLLDKAQQTIDWPLPVYSQYQAAQPGSVGYYLWSVECALQRDQAALARIKDDLSVCPLGAGAGAGTDFPILPEVSAALLGFERSADSALDAVASRDLALHLLSALAIGATTLSRLAHDLQLWTMRETAFLSLSDELSGSSSLMPQKKNPYLLENVKGKLSQVAGVLNSAIFATQRTPFSNSVEVGTEALARCGEAVLAFEESCDLLRLMIADMSGDPGKMRLAAEQGLVVAAQVANQLVRERQISFHAAHHQVGALITQTMDAGQDAVIALAGLTAASYADTGAASARLAYGGGPGAVAAGLARARERLRLDADTLRRQQAGWRAATLRRRERVAAASQPGS